MNSVSTSSKEVFFISDTHFGHANIIKYSNRPYKDARDMDETLIDNWNKIVGQNDTVYHLGDFAFLKLYEFKNILSRLNGKINVVLGNHDKVITCNKRELFEQGKIVSIKDYDEVTVGDKLVVLHHYGQRVWHQSHRGAYHLYGHSHGSLPPFGLSVDAGVDSKEITSEYRPVSFEEVRQYMDNRKPEKVDHHGD